MEYCNSALYTSATHPKISEDAVSTFFENITPLENTDQQMCEGKVSAEECLRAPFFRDRVRGGTWSKK